IVAAVALDRGRATSQGGAHVEHIATGVGATQQNAIVGGAVAIGRAPCRVIEINIVGSACKYADLIVGHYHVAVGRGPAQVADDQAITGAGPGVHAEGAGDGIQVTDVSRSIGCHVKHVVAAIALDLGRAASQGGLHVEHIGAGVGATQQNAIVGGAV